MPLLRAFSKVECVKDPVSSDTDEGGRVFIPSNIRKQAGVTTGALVEINVIRIKGSSRWPYLIVHPPGISLRLSTFQVVMREEKGRVDDENRLVLTNSIMEETKLKPDYRIEFKLAGPNRGSWLLVHNRGSARLTTLQEKMGRQGKGGRGEKKWKPMIMEY